MNTNHNPHSKVVGMNNELSNRLADALANAAVSKVPKAAPAASGPGTVSDRVGNKEAEMQLRYELGDAKARFYLFFFFYP